MISVIIPTYNSAIFLKDAIDCILRQTYNDFEIIVVDDGSTDNTKQVIDSYKASIRYFYQKNKGPSAARNRGLSHSLGEYVVFLDADDYWDDRFLEIMHNEISKMNLDVVVCDNYRIETKNGMIIKRSLERRSDILDQNTDLLTHFLANDLIGNPSKALIKRKILIEIKGYDEKILILQEWDLWIRFFSKPRNIKIIHLPLFYYHIRNDGSNITRRIGVKKYPTELYYIFKKFTFLVLKNQTLKKIYGDKLWDCARKVFKSRTNWHLFVILIFTSLKLDFSLNRILKSLKAQLP